MTERTITRDQARQVDRRAVEEYGMSGLVLMENAGRGVADVVGRLLAVAPSPAGGMLRKQNGPRIVVCCGKGNNAGDGFVIARHLDLRGYDVAVLLWAEPDELTGDAAANYQILAKTGVPIEVFDNRHDPARLSAALATAAWIVDALLGTGARGEPRPPLDAVIDAINAAGVPILSVDLPSGLDCDTGLPAVHAIRATVTGTFLALKAGFTAPGAGRYTGRVEVLDIGVPRKLLEDVLRRE
jgi:NAD(P)H-hydrate epimerase